MLVALTLYHQMAWMYCCCWYDLPDEWIDVWLGRRKTERERVREKEGGLEKNKVCAKNEWLVNVQKNRHHWVVAMIGVLPS